MGVADSEQVQHALNVAFQNDARLGDFERVISAHSAPQSSGELSLDRPYREAREIFSGLGAAPGVARVDDALARATSVSA
jgi:hypothetical protein